MGQSSCGLWKSLQSHSNNRENGFFSIEKNNPELIGSGVSLWLLLFIPVITCCDASVWPEPAQTDSHLCTPHAPSLPCSA